MLLFLCSESRFLESTKIRIEMEAKKVDALEEILEGKLNQIMTTVEERISSMEGQVADLRDMMKMLEVHNQTAASVAKVVEGKNTNSEIHREEDEVEIVDEERRKPYMEPFQREDRGGRYVERHGYGDMEQRGADWECREGSYGRRGAEFEGRRGDFEGARRRSPYKSFHQPGETENLDSFFFLLKKAENLDSFFFLLKKAENLVL
ncbi:hypothetical protein M5K25_023557 [Dendrobium thyrsiflorum]|uniref:Uncharacterized protein n=1 Tax=Dendrobium thyrsiflorum TaxID=117978 RepID=A0ABD0U926_DENTH